MRRIHGWFIASFACAWPIGAQAQTVDAVATAPPNLVLANYDSVAVGPFGGLEGSAYSARVGDPSAAWFNPAGLSRQRTAQISGSAGVYQRISLIPESLPDDGGSLQQLPNFVGFTFNVRGGLTAGAVMLTTTAWAQETDSELIVPRPNGQERFGFSADSDYSRSVGAIGLGYHRGGAWRVGGGLSLSMMDLRLVQSVSDRLGTDAGLTTLLVTARSSGNAVQLRGQGGVQYDWREFRFGAALRTPGLDMFGGGTLTLDGTLDSGGTSSTGASLFDSDAKLEYHLPWEFQAGAAWVTDRVELELDVLTYSNIDGYPMLSTPNPTLIYSSTGPGVPPTVESRPFPGLISASDAVVNVAFGGHVRVLRDRDFRVHGSVASNQSPVGAADQIFNQVDLLSWTIGVSGTWAKFQFAAGLNRNTGTSDDIVLRNLLTGDPIQTPIKIRTAGFIYSIAYQF